MKTSIVTTTINIPVLLRDYSESIQRYGHRDVDIIVIGDRKSPPDTEDFCQAINRQVSCTYLDIPAQEKYLADFPDLYRHIRFDCIQRRNIGMFMAYRNGADVVITIDDDNFVTNQDFVGLHGVVGTSREVHLHASTSGWLNVCSFLEVDDGVRFYHRGYPQKMRWNEREHFTTSCRATRRIAVNAGFWLDNPDIDALTRIERQPIVRGFNAAWTGNIALEPGTWSPFNSQNTSLMRAALPAYFLSPYIGRYDDIWASYVINRIAQHFGDVLTFGEPVVRQRRNPHDFWKDLDVERDGMILTDGFCEALRSIKLCGGSYHACFGEITRALPHAWSEGACWTDSQKSWRSRLFEGMQLWHVAFQSIGVS
jgi:glycosyltransferase involved in cell wall biosynthesis